MQQNSMKVNPSTVSLFKSSDEKINLFLPLLFLALGFIDAIFSWKIDLKTFFARIVVDIFLLNITHNAFTYIMILNLPELKPWMTQNGKQDEKKFWLKTLFLNAALVFFFFTLLSFMENHFIIIAFYFLSFFVPIHHALSQTFGLSLLYNQKIKSVHSMNKSEKTERYLFLLLLTTIFAISLLLSVAKVSAFSFPELKKIIFGLAWATVAITLTLFVSMFFYPSLIRLKKVIYSIRYILWGMIYFSPWAAWGAQAVHGVEYAFVTRKMMSASQKISWKQIGLILLVVVSILAYFKNLLWTSIVLDQPTSLGLKILSSTSIAISFSHYYLDRKLFQFRHSINRDTSGKLLLSNISSDSLN